MARAKNTSRSEARRRTRVTLRSEVLEADEAEDQDLAADQPAAPTARPRLFRMPNVRADLRALPQMFRSRRLLWAPLLLLVGGLVVTLALPGLPAQIGSIADLYIQFFFVPPALFTFFIAGFLAPRASYLVGLLYGLIAGGMWGAIILGPGMATSITTGTPTTVEPLVVIFNMLLIGSLYGTLAAAFAAWYRDFLRGMQERGKTRRAEQEAKERLKRRDERQEARRVAKQRPS